MFTAALHANPNYDGKDNAKAREEAIRRFSDQMDEEARKAIYRVHGIQPPDLSEPDWDDPLFANMVLPYDPKTGKPNPDYVKPDWMR